MRATTRKFNVKGGKVAVRFYKSGIYTFIDTKGNEHEAGIWQKDELQVRGTYNHSWQYLPFGGNCFFAFLKFGEMAEEAAMRAKRIYND